MYYYPGIAIFWFIILLSTAHVGGQDLVINEFMSLNKTTIQDEDGEYSDWIEIYNKGDSPITLSDYALSDDSSDIGKWVFPEMPLSSKGFLLVFASGKDRHDPAELHANFKIASSGEEIFLSGPGRIIIDRAGPASLPDDWTMARVPDGSNQWFECSNSTGGSSNDIANHLLFSFDQGFYSSPFLLDISSVMDDTVRFTLDGTIPTIRSDIYSGPLNMDFIISKPNYFSEIPTSPEQGLLSYKSWSSPATNIHKAHILRCASFKNGIRTSSIYTRTYFVDPSMLSRYTMPVVSIVTEEENLFGYEKGIFVPGIQQDPDRPGITGNYFMKGNSWERPVHIAYFEADGNLSISQNAGIRIHGGLTRHAAQKSLRLYARSEYGKSTFEYPLLPQKRVSSYKRFLLRSTMGGSSIDNATIRDVLAHELVREMDFEIQDFRPVIVYVNGEYWGIHTLRDRIDEHFIEYSFGIDQDSIDMINANIAHVDAGSNLHYLELAQFVDQNDLSIGENYEFIKTQIDINCLMDYVIAEMFMANKDWPGNNQKLWRPQNQEGKWRWIFLDLDIAFNRTIPDIFEHAMLEEGIRSFDTESVSSFLLRNLLKNSDFRIMFTDRFAQVLNEIITPRKILETTEKIMDLYRPEIQSHSARWNYPVSKESWEQDIETNLVSFLIRRRCEVAQHVIRAFDMPDFAFSCEGVNDFSENIIVAPNPSNGKFFIQNDSPYNILLDLTVIDVAGRSVYADTGISMYKFQRNHYDLSGLSSGTYFIKFTDGLNHIQPGVKAIIVY